MISINRGNILFTKLPLLQRHWNIYRVFLFFRYSTELIFIPSHHFIKLAISCITLVTFIKIIITCSLFMSSAADLHDNTLRISFLLIDFFLRLAHLLNLLLLPLHKVLLTLDHWIYLSQNRYKIFVVIIPLLLLQLFSIKLLWQP